MSVEAVSWAINKAPVGGNVTARMILVSLADKADEYGRDAWKYTSAIADSIRKSDATVFRTLAWLEEIGVIERGDSGSWTITRNTRAPSSGTSASTSCRSRSNGRRGRAAPAVRANRSGTRNRARNGRGKGRENPISK